MLVLSRESCILHMLSIKTPLWLIYPIWVRSQEILHFLSFKTMWPVDVWNLHLHGNDRSFAYSYQQLHSQPRLLVLEDCRTADTWANGWTTYKSKEVGWNWHRFKASQRGSDVFVSINSQKNLESEFLYWKVLFIPEIIRDNGILCLLVITRGLPDSLGFGDTWWFSSP